METLLGEYAPPRCSLSLLTSSEVELMETEEGGLPRVGLPRLLTSSEVELMETTIGGCCIPRLIFRLLTSSEVELMETLPWEGVEKHPIVTLLTSSEVELMETRGGLYKLDLVFHF